MMAPGPNGWNEWSRHVLAELERLNVCYETLNAKLDVLKVDFVAHSTDFNDSARMEIFMIGFVGSVVVGVVAAVIITALVGG